MKMVFASFVILFSTLSAQAVETGLEGVHSDFAIAFDSYCDGNKVITIISGQLIERQDCTSEGATCRLVQARIGKDNRPHIEAQCIK